MRTTALLPGCSTDQVTVTKPVTVTVQNAAGTPQSGLKVYAFSGSTYSAPALANVAEMGNPAPSPLPRVKISGSSP